MLDYWARQVRLFHHAILALFQRSDVCLMKLKSHYES